MIYDAECMDELQRQFESLQRTINALKHREALENIYARPDDRRRDDKRCEGDREHESRVRIAQGLLDAMGKARHEFDALRGCGREGERRA